VVDELLVLLPRLMRPRAVFRIDPVTCLQSRKLILSSGAVFTGAVATFLRHSQLIASFVVTIGSSLERLSRGWLRTGRVMQGVVADAIASEAVSAAVGRLAREVRDWARARGLEVTPPFSPGYCGMSLQQQRPLFDTLPTRTVNVRLTPSCLMVPLKSVSGLMGVGRPGSVSPDAYPCELCDQADCRQRRAPSRAGSEPIGQPGPADATAKRGGQ